MITEGLKCTFWSVAALYQALLVAALVFKGLRGSGWALISLRLHDHFSRRKGGFTPKVVSGLSQFFLWFPQATLLGGVQRQHPYTLAVTLTCSLIT